MSTNKRNTHLSKNADDGDCHNCSLTHDEWGNGMVYVSDGDSTGAWVGYDPETVVDLDSWR